MIRRDGPERRDGVPQLAFTIRLRRQAHPGLDMSDREEQIQSKHTMASWCWMVARLELIFNAAVALRGPRVDVKGRLS